MVIDEIKLQNLQKFLKLLKLTNCKHLLAKKNQIWIWTTVDKYKPVIIDWVVGEVVATLLVPQAGRSSETFKTLWQGIKSWNSFWYVTDGYAVYKSFISAISQIVSKTYMTRVEGENTRLRHYLARLKRKTLCYSKSVEMLEHSLKLL